MEKFQHFNPGFILHSRRTKEKQGTTRKKKKIHRGKYIRFNRKKEKIAMESGKGKVENE